MANYRYSRYQYETSPRKLEPEYEPIESPYKHKKKSTAKIKQEKVRPKRKNLLPKVSKKKYVQKEN